ncbi:hypothetical protein [Thermoactinomyces sp. CICC 10521]|uniref:hypothetical protein n=1 Tax=Thermoactinomyces sp. CICC 10521 TaxID=2767426 RepID=UPI0018DD0081|nr:hypothetical protein [Thermoactinomyces sp. CICC 10521]MBH8606024.1 hypothetical protein [Thermoactinomyces sp. CICC 10521]
MKTYPIHLTAREIADLAAAIETRKQRIQGILQKSESQEIIKMYKREMKKYQTLRKKLSAVLSVYPGEFSGRLTSGGGDKVNIRWRSFNDRGVLKYRIYKCGKFCGYLTLPGLLQWINENEKPASGQRSELSNSKITWIFSKCNTHLER